MGVTTGRGRRKITAVAAVIVAAGLAGACGSPAAPSPTSSATAPASVSPTSALEQFRAAANGPAAKKLQADVATFVRDASSQDFAAAEADARTVAADITAWADTLRPIQVPASLQAAKAAMLRGLDLMSKGVTELANGMRDHDMAQITKGTADVQQATTIINQASSLVR